MAMKDRRTLKNYFKKGNLPSAANFENLIDSTVNKIDDGFSKTPDDGLMLSKVGDSTKVISIYEHIEDDKAQWTIDLELLKNKNNADNHQLHFCIPAYKKNVLTLSQEGKVGINNTRPKYDLDVNNLIGCKGQVGTYSPRSEIPADGNWYRIISNLNHCQGFEIVARTGVKNTGKHALVHAIALSAYGKSFAKIKKTSTRYSFWRPIQIQFRWTGDTFNYHLEMRCKQNLGDNAKVKYYITQLWNDEEMGIKSQFMDENLNKGNETR